MVRSDLEGLAGHEEHVGFPSCVRLEPLEGLEQRKDMTRRRFKEPLWLLYPCELPVHSRCSLNVGGYYHCFQALELTESRNLNRVILRPQHPVQRTLRCVDKQMTQDLNK